MENVQFATSGADFVRYFPYMAAAGVRQHPQQGAVLAAGGGATGGGDGGGAGGSARPSSGMLWPPRS